MPSQFSELARRRGSPALAVLLIALASLFALGGDRAYFQREGGNHNEMSSKNLAIAENLSPRSRLILALRQWRNDEGGREYDFYGRFPVGGYILIKLAILPFGGDLSAGLAAARFLMLFALCGAALFAYLALARIAGSRWVALAATLFAFSGFQVLYYADAVSGEASMDIFGVALTFHGMTVFAQEGRFRQLLVKACAALLVGWHVYGLLLPFIALGFGGEAVALVRTAVSGGGGFRAALTSLPALIRSRYVALAAVAILFGSALLALNFANEYAAFGGERTLWELPSAQSAAERTSLDKPVWESYAETLGNARFWGHQFTRAGAASVPYALAPSLGDRQREFWGGDFPAASIAAGVLATVGALAAAAAAFARRCRILWASLASMGFCWAVLANGSVRAAEHYFEGVFFIGLPLTIIAVALMGVRSLLGARRGETVAAALGAASAVVFALSALWESQPYRDNVGMAAESDMEMLSELREMRNMAMGKSVLVSEDVRTYGLVKNGVDYAFAGGFAVYEWETHPADFTASRYRSEAFATLTPDNRFAFLYEGRVDPAELRREEWRRLDASEPAARAAFDVYIADSALRYLKSPCAPEDAESLFFAHFFPADSVYARRDGGREEFDGINFLFSQSGIMFDGVCIATAPLPDYPVSDIRTGQFVSDSQAGRGASKEGAWEVRITPPLGAETLALYENAYREIASGEPTARAAFDLHLRGNALTYLKQPCSDDDARGRFLLSVHPADLGDLPAERREIGHESLNFDFAPPHGAIFNGKCMATRRLPDYGIAKIDTGQWIPGGERLWEVEIAVGD